MTTPERKQEPQGFDTDTMARLVRSTPPEQLRKGLEVNRDVLIGEVFRRMPERVSAQGRDQKGVIQFKITGRSDGGADHWFLVLENGEARTGKELGLRARTTLVMDALTFLQLVTGNANPMELFLRRRLRVRGDLIFASRLPSLMSIPRTPRAD